MNFFVKHKSNAQVKENLVQQAILSEAASELLPERQHMILILIHAKQKKQHHFFKRRAKIKPAIEQAC
jgi:hypothetical protein